MKTIEDFFSQDASDFVGDIELPEQEILWIDAQQGIDWASALIEKLKSEKPQFPAGSVIEDLEEALEVFAKTKKINAKWHFELDF
ncbi:MAG: hypothetical protein HKN25_16790 [Pyrinomonadaceae bacterium]|nr:hypothetical protein [Pyrinomonadaceae bacterium]